LIRAILTEVRWNFIVFLIFISLMVSDIQHFFIYILAICAFSLEKCLWRQFVHFFTSISFGPFLLLNCLSFLHILDINSLLDE
jgi:hypothetical protein